MNNLKTVKMPLNITYIKLSYDVIDVISFSLLKWWFSCKHNVLYYTLYSFKYTSANSVSSVSTSITLHLLLSAFYTVQTKVLTVVKCLSRILFVSDTKETVYPLERRCFSYALLQPQYDSTQ